MLDRRYITLSILATTLSYTKAAQRLFITQPAVSQQINSLEQELDTKLIEKDGNRIKLTTAGHQLVQYVDKISFESDRVLQQIKTKQAKQTIEVGATLSLSIFLLPTLISHLVRTNPKIKTVIANTNKILTALRQGKIQFGIVEGNFDKNEFDAVNIRHENFVGVTYPDNPLAKYNQLSLDDLMNQTLLIRELGSGTRDIFANWLATQNYTINDFTNQVEVANPSTIIHLLLNKMGISFMYESLVTEQLSHRQLVKLPLKNFDISHPINFVFLKNSYFKPNYLKIAQKLIN